MKSLLDYKDDTCWLMHGDCLDRMKEIPDGSVDAVICDPPYGTTRAKWDSIIPLDLMWAEVARIVKPIGNIIMTASQPFTSQLTVSNLEMFKYSSVWRKSCSSNPQHANYQPLKVHEDVLIFTRGGTGAGSKNPATFNKQYGEGKPYQRGFVTRGGTDTTQGGFKGRVVNNTEGTRNPTSVIDISNPRSKGRYHPTQKPVALMEYLVKTYTNGGESVLDFTYGSGTTGVACMNLNRKFIGIEMDDNYFNIGKERILQAKLDNRINTLGNIA